MVHWVSLLDSHLMIYSKEFGAHVHAKSGSFYTGKKLINRTRNCVSLRFYPGIHIKETNLVLSGAVFFLKIDMQYLVWSPYQTSEQNQCEVVPSSTSPDTQVIKQLRVG